MAEFSFKSVIVEFTCFSNTNVRDDLVCHRWVIDFNGGSTVSGLCDDPVVMCNGVFVVCIVALNTQSLSISIIDVLLEINIR